MVVVTHQASSEWDEANITYLLMLLRFSIIIYNMARTFLMSKTLHMKLQLFDQLAS
jgi:hypothetical protein